MVRTLDEHKICFITAVRDKAKYQESMAYWQRLRVPEGMTVQYIGVSDWPSIGQAYQMAMGKSDAKYKIYIHDNIWLTQTDFLEVLIQMFKEHPEYGIASVAGSTSLPESCHWRDQDPIGCVCDNHQEKMLGYTYQQATQGTAPVMLLHEGLLVTQYDISWHTELYDKGHLYAASQCMELRRHGYGAVVLPQLGPGVQHWCGEGNVAQEYPEVGKRLVREYRDVLLQAQPLVSVIVPVYNGEAYLQSCLEGLLGQSYSNLEIILIDDASTDSSWEMMNRLYKDNPRVILLHHDVNQGAGAARNTALDIAKGKYISFVDSDDSIDKDYIETLVVLAEANQVDIAACCVEFLDPDGSTRPCVSGSFAVDGGMPVLMAATKGAIGLATWGRIIARKIIIEHNLRYQSTGLEDIIFWFKAVYHANRYVRISEVKYHYVQREGSLSHAGHAKHCNYIRNFCQILFTVEEMLQEIRQTTQVTKEQEKAIYSLFLSTSLIKLVEMLNQGHEQAERELAEEMEASFGRSAIYIESLLNLMLKPKKQ